MIGLWRLDPAVLAGCALAIAFYAAALRARRRRLGRPGVPAPRWPRGRTAALVAALLTTLAALVSPLEDAADRAFAPHMLQHLLLTDVVAPLVLLAAPVPLLLAALPVRAARAVVRLLRSRAAHLALFPGVTWTLFVATLWIWHVGPFFELALDDERIHAVEHVVYLGSSLLFWLPVVAIAPTPWTEGPLAYPLRMLYVLLAMPAEGFLGFAIYGAPRVLYPHYRAAGLADQHAAGELMWIGSGLAMFVAFMLVGAEWGAAERRLGEQENRRLDRAISAR